MHHIKRFKSIFFKDLISFFYPSFCKQCKTLVEQGEVFCFDCERKIQSVVSFDLHVTLNKSVKVFAASSYKDPLKSLILQKANSQILASKQLAKIILKKTNIKNFSFDYIVPIPLHWTRYSWRGYNQAYVMGKQIGKVLNVPVLNLLKREKRTIFQSKLHKDQRLLNVKNVFDLKFRYKKGDKDFFKDKKILLVDDLFTTGATVKNASKVLFKLNPKEVSVVVACRVV